MHSGRISREESLRQDFEVLSISKRLVRSVSRKLKKKNLMVDGDGAETSRGVALNCLTLYGRVGGCKVGADIGDDSGYQSSRRRSHSSEEAKEYKMHCGIEETGLDCFSRIEREKFWRRSNCKLLGLVDSAQTSCVHQFLPDDIVEMCLVRLPLASLMKARLVCKKWRQLTSTARFQQMRREGLYQNPWLFLFGVVRDGFCSGEVHAFDLFQDQWHRIDSEILKGRFMFSVAGVRDEIYVVGGRSGLNNSGRMDRSSCKTHKGVLVFSPLTKSWHKIPSMRHARSSPILGISEVGSSFLPIQNHQPIWHERRSMKSHVGVSDVYEDPHRLSLRRQSRNAFDADDYSFQTKRRSHKLVRQKIDQRNHADSKGFLLIVVGGFGTFDEPLESGEIYDSTSNTWTDIQRLPLGFGIASSGVVCSGIFYVYSETDRLAGYDIERGFWVGIQTSPIPPRVHDFYPKLVSCNNRLFMLLVSWCEGDGQIGRRNKAVRKLWELDLMYLSWSEVCVHPDAPMDWNAAFVADKNLLFGVEMFKIFGQVLNFFTMCDISESGAKWRHISRNHMAHELEASSCMTKSMAVLYL